MGTHANSRVESPVNDGMCAVEAPTITQTITPGWVDGNRARRYFQNPLLDRLLGSLFPDQRIHPRFSAPPIVAYLGNVGSSKLFPILNVSVGGFCLSADEFWTPGAVMPITLQRWRTIPQDAPEALTVQAMLVRREGNAAGFAIALALEESLLFPHMRKRQVSNLQQRMADFLRDLSEPIAKAKVEPINAAISASVARKAERLEMMMDRAKPYSLSTETYVGTEIKSTPWW